MNSKIVKKAYGVSAQSKAGYKEAEGKRESLVNFESTVFNIVDNRDQRAKIENHKKKFSPSDPAARCYNNYSISAFSHVSRPSAANVNPDYLAVYKKNQKVFSRKNGEFTGWFDQLGTQKFLGTPFKKDLTLKAAGK